MDPDRHDALRQHIVDSFAPVLRSKSSAESVPNVLQNIMDTVHIALADLAREWNANSLQITHILTEDALASCFFWLPYKDLIRAASVSHAWRTVALAHSSLWSNLFFQRPIKPPMQPTLSLLISRPSKPLRVMFVSLSSRAEPSLEFLLSHISRMRAFRFQARDSPVVSLSDISAPYLEDLDVSFTITGLPNAPRLQRLAVEKFQFEHIPASGYPSIVSFSGFLNPLCVPPKLDDLFPNIVHLRLDVVYLEQFSFSAIPSTLRSLRIDAHRQNDTGFVRSLTQYVDDLRRHDVFTVDKWVMERGPGGLFYRASLIGLTYNLDISVKEWSYSPTDLRDFAPLLTHYTTIAGGLAIFNADVSYPHLQHVNIENGALDLNFDHIIDAPTLRTLRFTMTSDPSHPRSDFIETAWARSYFLDKVLNCIVNKLPKRWTHHFTVPRLDELILSGYPARILDAAELAAVFSYANNFRYNGDLFSASV